MYYDFSATLRTEAVATLLLVPKNLLMQVFLSEVLLLLTVSAGVAITKLNKTRIGSTGTIGMVLCSIDIDTHQEFY